MSKNDAESPAESSCGFFPESSDTYLVTLRGALDEKEVANLLDVATRFAEGKQALFALCDISAATSLSAGARKIASIRSARLPLRAIGIIGGGFHIRVMVSLLTKTMQFIQGKEGQMSVSFFATEVEARSWLNERKNVVLQETNRKKDVR
jgi:hypothetical protein